MAKRFTDTNKYKKPFIRGLEGPYKLLWDYLYHDCDHAGIWVVDFKIAQIYIGEDMPVNRKDALKYFNDGEKHIIEIDNRKKWFIPSFIDFQYGELHEGNRAHNSVLNILKKYNLLKIVKLQNKPLVSPLEGAMDMDKVLNKDLLLIKNLTILPKFQGPFLTWLKYKRKKGQSYKDQDSTYLAYQKLLKLSNRNSITAKKIVEQSMANNWAGLFELKEEERRNNNGSRRSGKNGMKYVEED
jgi:hypothetical protein